MATILYIDFSDAQENLTSQSVAGTRWNSSWSKLPCIPTWPASFKSEMKALEGLLVNSYSSQLVLKSIRTLFGQFVLKIFVNSYSKVWSIRTLCHGQFVLKILVNSYSFWSIRTHVMVNEYRFWVRIRTQNGQFVLKCWNEYEFSIFELWIDQNDNFKCDLSARMWRLYMACVNCYQHLEIFSRKIWVMPVKLQFATLFSWKSFLKYESFARTNHWNNCLLCHGHHSYLKDKRKFPGKC